MYPNAQIRRPPIHHRIDQRRILPRQRVHVLPAARGGRAHVGVAQVGEVRVVELDVAAAGFVERVDLLPVDGGEVGEEDVQVGVGVDVNGGAL